MTLKRQQSLEDTARLRALGGLNMPAAAGNLVLPAGPGSFLSPSVEEPASRSESCIATYHDTYTHTHTHTHTHMYVVTQSTAVRAREWRDWWQSPSLPLSLSPDLSPWKQYLILMELRFYWEHILYENKLCRGHILYSGSVETIHFRHRHGAWSVWAAKVQVILYISRTHLYRICI
jgi:hypothetical protein